MKKIVFQSSLNLLRKRKKILETQHTEQQQQQRLTHTFMFSQDLIETIYLLQLWSEHKDTNKRDNNNRMKVLFK